MEFSNKQQLVFSLMTLFTGFLIQGCNAHTLQPKATIQSPHSQSSNKVRNVSNSLVTKLSNEPTAKPGASYYSNAKGFILSGKSSLVSSENPKGNEVCDYPSKSSCVYTETAYRGKGASRILHTNLNPDANIHIVKFKFFSDKYFEYNPSAHFALALRGKSYFNNENSAIGHDGRGIIIGNISSRNMGNPACDPTILQIETFSASNMLFRGRPEGNAVFPETCSTKIFNDGVWYTIEVYVSLDLKIGYKIKDSLGQLIVKQMIKDPTDFIDRSLNDFMIAHVFDEVPTVGRNWSIIVDQISFSESNQSFEAYFGVPAVSFYLGNQKLKSGEKISMAQIKSQGLFIGPFHSLINNVYGCFSNESLCETFEQYKNLFSHSTFDKTGEKLKLNLEAIKQMPKDVHTLKVRTNPMASWDQVTVLLDLTNQDSATSSNHEVIGYIDGISSDYVVSGWLCNKGIEKSIDYHIYTSAPGKQAAEFIGGRAANQVSEPQVAVACGVSSGTYRFSFKLPTSAVGKAIHIFGISISGDNQNKPITNSGKFVVSAPSPIVTAPIPTIVPNPEPIPTVTAPLPPIITAPIEKHCSRGEFPNGSGLTMFACDCAGDFSSWILQPDGCYHKIK